MSESFSLKDQLFNAEKVTGLSQRIHSAYTPFNHDAFCATVISQFPSLELKQRIACIRNELRAFLPKHYPDALTILLNALPEPCDPTRSDDDFGDFIYCPLSDFVAEFGCEEHYLDISLPALEAITTRFSAEDAIREFINRFPSKTQHYLHKWSSHSHYHVRRLVSEGTRPKLPWCRAISLTSQQTLPLLTHLHSDSTRYVTRSVANHMNDISKTDPDIVIHTLKEWQQSKKQSDKELAFITRHSLRTLVKNGHAGALEMLGFSAEPQVTFTLSLQNTIISIGDTLYFHLDYQSNASHTTPLLIDFIISFQRKNGTMGNKVFKWTTQTVNAGCSGRLSKKYTFKKGMSTRTFYPGEHTLSIQVNGRIVSSSIFEVTEPTLAEDY